MPGRVNSGIGNAIHTLEQNAAHNAAANAAAAAKTNVNAATAANRNAAGAAEVARRQAELEAAQQDSALTGADALEAGGGLTLDSAFKDRRCC